jgi:hypothetical protein
MAYGELKVDSITFTNGGTDTTVSVSGLVQNPTFSGDITVTGTISGDVILGGTTVSGATVTGDAAEFTSITGGTAGFTTVTGTTVTGTTANFATVSGTTITGDTAGFTTVTGTTVTGTTANFVTVSGTTVTGNTGNFTSISATTTTITSGVFASGTAAAPSVSVGTTNNGLYSPGLNQVAISTNGTGRLFVDSSGNVGVGTTSPGAQLEISNTGNVRIYADASGGYIEQTVSNLDSLHLISSGPVKYQSDPQNDTAETGHIFECDGSEKARIDSSGRLGLGTASPDELLDVAGTTKSQVFKSFGGFSDLTPLQLDRGSTGSGLHIELTSGAYSVVATDKPLRLNADYANGFLEFRINNSEKARLDSSGRLLINTSSSTSFVDSFGSTQTPLLEISTNSNTNSSILLKWNSGSAGATRRATFAFYRTADGVTVSSDSCLGEHLWLGEGGADTPVKAASISAFVDGTPGANDMPGRLVFSTTADGASSPTERMRITSAGVLQIADAGDIAVGTTTGTKIGTATSQKIGFYNATPVVQPTAVADATDAATVITQLNDLLAKLRTLGLIAT